LPLENVVVLQLQKHINQTSRLKSREIETYKKNATLRGPKQRQLFKSFVTPPLPECPGNDLILKPANVQEVMFMMVQSAFKNAS